MAYSKFILLLGIFILGFWGQISSGLATKKGVCFKGSPVVNSAPESIKQWNNFKQQHKLSYEYNETEICHMNYFLQNMDFIKNRSEVMSSKDTFKLDINTKFLTYDFNNTNPNKCITEENLSSSQKPCLTKNISLYNQHLKSKDWKEENRVSRTVHDQGQCTSCWAFSAVAILEGWFAMENKKLVEYSPQQLVDCHGTREKGCEKARQVPYAFTILKKWNDSLATLQAYPYLQKSGGKCALSEKIVHTFTGKCSRLYSGSPSQKENQLKEAVARYGPVSASIYTHLQTFKFYKSGIYNDKACSGTYTPTHAVTVVGFGYEKNQHYWIIKNSWGEGWGEQGYMRLEMGNNLCGIANYVYFITKANDTDGDIPETSLKFLGIFGKTKSKSDVGSGSSSLHGTSVGMSVNIICFAILSCFLVSRI